MNDDGSKRVAEAIALLCEELGDQAGSMACASDVEAAAVTLIRDVGRRVLTEVLQGKIDAGVKKPPSSAAWWSSARPR